MTSTDGFDWCARCDGLTEHHDRRCRWCGHRQRPVGWLLLVVVLLLGWVLGCGAPPEQGMLVEQQTVTSILGPDAGTRLCAFLLPPRSYRLVTWACSSAPDAAGMSNARLNPDGAPGPLIETPLCPQKVPTTWQGPIQKGVNVTLLSTPPSTVGYTAHLEAWALP